ncbi:MAG: radical SAM family heme chaperone HemW [Anaerovibrio sp.]|uniref:radical SAM family heme chaperone HemW n=1 Tax=Anaerovibrio sp. TaxID=1872532 RepID=UPI0025F3D0E2|nr:radical SAM family heme chaperone HemW [Anaerovibrio sp.]MCR5175359.1 radical SAM family heme chaperone HemW [Anaerovibrio sp.]
MVIDNEFGVYIHIPFCRQKCFYCDFPSFAGRENLIDDYLNALSEEMRLVTAELGQGEKLSPSTIYIGGGTPSILDSDQLNRLLTIIREKIDLAGVAEFTVEVNPCSVTAEKLHLMRQSGINRISIGIQSFDDGCLKSIGRLHSGREALQAVSMAQMAGFDNISIDLMYGLPGQSMDMLEETVATALKLEVRHISVYGLQLEEGTVFARQQAMGKLLLPEDELVEEMYDYIVRELPIGGFQRYEISNYARPGYESRHNCLYWQDVPYLGFGAGAHSYWSDRRYENPVNIKEYIQVINGSRVMSMVEEEIDTKAHMEEYCFLGLRMTRGINRESFRNRFACDVHDIFGNAIDNMVSKGLLAENEEAVFLTELGMKYGNIVFAEFIL